MTLLKKLSRLALFVFVLSSAFVANMAVGQDCWVDGPEISLDVIVPGNNLLLTTDKGTQLVAVADRAGEEIEKYLLISPTGKQQNFAPNGNRQTVPPDAECRVGYIIICYAIPGTPIQICEKICGKARPKKIFIGDLSAY